jgi:membrane protease YdiL (CAAX protease family)
MSTISERPDYRVFLFWAAFAGFAFFAVLLMREISGPAIQIFLLLTAVCAAYLVPFSAGRYAGRREAMAARLLLRALPFWDCLLIALAALLLLPAMIMVFEQGLRLFPGYLEYARGAEAVFRRGLAGQGVLALFYFFAVLPVLCEEFFFRGLFASCLREAGLSRPLCMLLGAVFFAIMHLDPWRLLPMFVVGMILIWLAERSGSILAPIIYHCAHNALVLGLSLWRITLENYGNGSAESQEFLQGETPAFSSVLFIIILAVLGICALWRFAMRASKE